MSRSSSNHHGDNELTLPAFGLIEPERVLATDNFFAVVSDKFPVSPYRNPRKALGERPKTEVNAREK